MPAEKPLAKAVFRVIAYGGRIAVMVSFSPWHYNPKSSYSHEKRSVSESERLQGFRFYSPALS